MNRGSIEIRGGGDPSPIGEGEVVRECLDGASHPIAARAAQLNEVLRRRKGDEEASVIAQDPAEFLRIHPRRDRQDDRKGAVGVGHKAIGICHNPLTSGVAPGSGISGRNRDVDTMGIAARLEGKGAEVKTVTAARIKNGVGRRCIDDRSDSAQQWLGEAAVVQSPPGCDGSRRVARLRGSPLLRLEQVDVSAARDVKRMFARTEPPPFFSNQRHVAAADGAKEHELSVADSESAEIPAPVPETVSCYTVCVFDWSFRLNVTCFVSD